MIQIKIKDEQREHAFALVKKTNFGNRGIFDGDVERQYTGILGETIFADMFSLKRPTSGMFDNDYGIDFEMFNKKIDLKTMGRNVYVRDDFVNNLIVSQVDNGLTDIYVFSSINKVDRVFELIGYLNKKSIIKNSLYVPAGTKRRRSDGTFLIIKMDMYEIPNNRLIPINSVEDFRRKLLR